MRNLLIMLVWILTIIFVINTGLDTAHCNNKTEKSIIVINKTTEIDPCGLFGSATDYLILGDDGNVYYTKDWKIYYNMKIGKKYKIKTRNLHGFGYLSDYWTIEEVEGV